MKNPIVAASLCLLFFACDSESSGKVQNPVDLLTPAQKLAILDHVDTSSRTCRLIDAYLEHIAETFHEPQDTIADYTSRAEGVLKDKGIVTTNVDILRDMDGFKRPDSLDYKSAVTMYAMIRTK